MSIYILTSSIAHEFPETSVLVITTDRHHAVSEFTREVLEEVDDDQEREEVEHLARHFEADDTLKEMSWIVNNQAGRTRIKEMIHFQIHVKDADDYEDHPG